MAAPAKGTALVTGGAGFIGSHLCELLLDGGWEVYALDDLSTGSTGNLAALRSRQGFHLVVESVLSRAVVSELVHRSDAVFHLAAAVGVRLIVEQPGRTLLTNVQGTETVLEYCARFSKRVLVASSSEVYGDHREERALDEDARRIYGPTTSKRWAYAATKAMDEFLALAAREERGLDCVIARLFNTVGPRQSGQYGNVLPRFVQAALEEAPLEVHGDGTQTRCFCHVADVVRALAGLVAEPSTGGGVYNVGSTDRIRIVDLANRVLEATGSSSELTFVPYEDVYGLGIDEMFHRAPAIDKIGAAIGWSPELELDQILADVVADVRTRTAAAPAAVEP